MRNCFGFALLCFALWKKCPPITSTFITILRWPFRVTCIWFNFYRFIVSSTFMVIVLYIHQFRYIKIQTYTIDISTRLWEINTEFVGFIPQSLVLRSICVRLNLTTLSRDPHQVGQGIHLYETHMQGKRAKSNCIQQNQTKMNTCWRKTAIDSCLKARLIGEIGHC